MTATVARPARKAVLTDLGDVLICDYLPAAAAGWGTRLGVTEQAFLGALFGGSDDQVLTGRISEPAWWDIVAGRLRVVAVRGGERVQGRTEAPAAKPRSSSACPPAGALRPPPGPVWVTPARRWVFRMAWAGAGR